MTPEERRAKRAAAARAYYWRKRDVVRQRQNERYLSKREEHLERQRNYRAAKLAEDPDHFKKKRREFYEANREKLASDVAEYIKREPDKHRARVLVHHRVQRGRWPRASFFKCTDCEAQATLYHHPDYSFPLWVEPLCSCCHNRIHHSLSK